MRFMPASLRLQLAATVAVSALTGGAAHAQNADDGTAISEIVVTARRKDERLQDVPTAVSAFTEATLRDRQAADIGGLEGAVPNLSLHVGDASNAVVYIRGVGQIDSLAFNDPGVGIYVDDVYLGRAQGAFLDVYDVDRIEVLRGPQGTLYGRNTIGGAVKIVSRALKTEFGGEAEAQVGSDGWLQGKLSVDMPISDRLLSKVAIARTVRDGFSKNAHTGKDDGDKDTLAARLALEFKATDDLTLRLNVDGSRDRPNASRTPARATAVFGTFAPTTDHPFNVDADFTDRNDLTTTGVSLVADWKLSDTLSLKSISAWRQMTYGTKLDLDATPAAFFGVYVSEAQNQESQELQLNYDGDRLSAVGGLFVFREHDVTYSGLYGPAIGLVTGSLNDQLNKSYAIYGQGSYELTERLSLTAGLRYTQETKDFARTQKYFAATTPFPVVYSQPGLLATDIDTDADWSSLSPKVGLDFHATPDVLVYGSVSRGFKSGGFDGRANDSGGAKPYDPETLWAYEAGVKSVLMDRKLIANAALFWNDYKDLQLSSFVADAQGNFAALFTNAGKATMKGAEIELVARPTDGLTLNANLGYLDGQYDRYIGPGGVDISNQRKLVNAPKWTSQLGATYSFAAPGGEVTVGGDVATRSKTYVTVSTSEVLSQKAYTLASAFVRYEADAKPWWLQAGVKNIGDKRYIQHGFDLSDSLGYQLAYYGDPRTWAVSLGFRF